MQVSKVVKQGGQGAFLLLLYLVGSSLIWFPEAPKFRILVPAGIVVFLVAYLIGLFSDEVIGFLYWPTLVEVKRTLDEKNDGEHFYFGHRENWEKLDEYDDKVYRNTVAIVSGVIISVTLPLQGFFYPGIWADVFCLLGSLFSIVAFIYKPYEHSKETIMTAPRLYE